jgi:hypothetical protein
VIFATAAILLSLTTCLLLIVGTDVYLHQRAERSAGLNLWGYRGPRLGRKAPNEVRIAFLGGSSMFGYGLTWDQAIPAVVERELTGPEAPVRAANLALNNEGAYSFLYTLQDYAYLDPDIVVLYEGYNDLMGDEDGGNTSLLRHQSAVFRLTGYYPILPLVLNERAMLLRHGTLDAAYAAARGEQPAAVFTPNAASRSAAAAIETANSIGQSVGRQLSRLQQPVAKDVQNRSEAGCAPPWSMYCQSVFRAIQFALARGQRVAVGSQPIATDGRTQTHLEQQRALIDMLERRFAGDARVVHIDLRDAVDLNDTRLSFDEMHLTVVGNQLAGERMATALRPLVTDTRNARP